MNIQIEWEELNKVVADYVSRKTGLDCHIDNVCFSVEASSIDENGDVDDIQKIVATVNDVESN